MSKKEQPDAAAQASPPEAKKGAEIQTLEDLRAAYPDLVSQLAEQQTKQLKPSLANGTAEQLQEHFPELYARVAAHVQKGYVPDLSVKGFVLLADDPFAPATLRTFASLAKRGGLHLPFVLPFKDKHTPAALQGYIVRAEGGGDLERGKAARGALKKCK